MKSFGHHAAADDARIVVVPGRRGDADARAEIVGDLVLEEAEEPAGAVPLQVASDLVVPVAEAFGFGGGARREQKPRGLDGAGGEDHLPRARRVPRQAAAGILDQDRHAGHPAVAVRGDPLDPSRG